MFLFDGRYGSMICDVVKCTHLTFVPNTLMFHVASVNSCYTALFVFKFWFTMADKFPNSQKKVFNPLLNVSVTGATFEEFTQNVLLCPVQDPPQNLQQIPLNGK